MKVLGSSIMASRGSPPIAARGSSIMPALGLPGAPSPRLIAPNIAGPNMAARGSPIIPPLGSPRMASAPPMASGPSPIAVARKPLNIMIPERERPLIIIIMAILGSPIIPARGVPILAPGSPVLPPRASPVGPASPVSQGRVSPPTSSVVLAPSSARPPFSPEASSTVLFDDRSVLESLSLADATDGSGAPACIPQEPGRN
mmetsp:Transcript_9259/g.26583  ORF Transcript_9259/g.26583 Transcript_9259/m.26583 type:complete len:201 (-) Transcript_9259:106-708(-)